MSSKSVTSIDVRTYLPFKFNYYYFVLKVLNLNLFIFVLSKEHFKVKHLVHLYPIIETEEQSDSDVLAAGRSTNSNLQ